MSDLDDCTPRDIPPEFEAFKSEPAQMGVGQVGKVGQLRLLLERDVESQRTVIRSQFSRVPLLVQRALYLEEALPSMAYVYLISPSEGVLQGDRYRMDIALEKGAQAHITTQSATKVYRMDANYATQIVNIFVDDGCYLEFVPDQIIPYRNSRFYQRVDMKIHDNATVLYSETITPGRAASGESFRYDICFLRTVAVNQDNVYRIADSAMLQPKGGSLGGIGMLSDFETVGFVYVLTTADHVLGLNETLNGVLGAASKIRAGCTILPRNSGLMIRILGHSAEDVMGAIRQVVTLVRKAVLDAPFTGVRKP